MGQVHRSCCVASSVFHLCRGAPQGLAAHDMSILRDLGVLGCLTAVSLVISLRSVVFPREGGIEIRWLSESPGYTTLSPEHEGYGEPGSRTDEFPPPHRSIAGHPQPEG